MTKEDFQQWKESKTTKEILDILREARSQCAEQCVKCSASGDNQTASKLAGNIETFDFLINIDFEDATND